MRIATCIHRILLIGVTLTLTCTCLALATSAEAATYYVREGGGTIDQCNGLVDADYPGSGTNQDCAVNHLYWLHGLVNNPTVLQGGDTVIVSPGSYEFGYNGPNNTNTSQCHASWPYDCNMMALPSGTPENPTRILGKGWDSGCDNPPEFWGGQRANHVISLVGSNNIEMQCIDITDHESCIEHQGSDGCPRGAVPTGDWTGGGIYAKDSDNVLLANVNIHGMAVYGIKAGRVSNWELRDSVIRGNGFAGWDGDLNESAGSSNSGDIKFIRTSIEFNGCSEDYPVVHSGSAGISRCWSQNQGGYGDAIGLGTTNGHWYFEDTDVIHNVSDGIDMLYADTEGSLTVLRGRFEGNAGNQIKSGFDTVIEDAKIIGNCAFFGGRDDLTWDGGTDRAGWGGNCRALGNSLAFAIKKPGQRLDVINSTITGQGDVLLQSSGDACDGSEVISGINNIWVGGNQHYHDGDTDLYYAAGATGNGDGSCGSLGYNFENTIVHNVKHSPCPDADITCVDPQFTGVTLGHEIVADDPENFDVSLNANSPAIDAGQMVASADSLDNRRFDRGTLWDLGAFEVTDCGNGIVNNNEVCDDGANNGTEGFCNSTCSGLEEAKQPSDVCGDLLITGDEVCDGGNRSCTDASGHTGVQNCNSSCSGYDACVVQAVCGDSVMMNGEFCDSDDQSCVTSGGYAGVMGCNNTCSGYGACVTSEFCGDGIVNGFEGCDDGNNISADGCSSLCQPDTAYQLFVSHFSDRSNAQFLEGVSTTGDLFVFLSPETGVQRVMYYFDDPAMTGMIHQTEGIAPYDFSGTEENVAFAKPFHSLDHATGAHNITASVTLTNGDRIVVSSNFTLDHPVAICGNHELEDDEVCDSNTIDCTTADGYAGTQACTDQCDGFTTCHSPLFCGDGMTNGNELCDDHVVQSCVTSDGYAGTSQCNLQCDGFDACASTLHCGDGIVNGNEECDDGNTDSQDGCSATCEEETLYHLYVSSYPDRSSAQLLEGGNVIGDMHVFLFSEFNVQRVQFYLDDAQMNGSPRQTENVAPYDFAGTDDNVAFANTFDSTQLSEGAHNITALVTLQNGQTVVVGSSFNVQLPPPVCGDNVQERGEVCDGDMRFCTTSDGYNGAQVCNSQCSGFDSCVSSEFCGDGTVNGNEVCDDGNNHSGDGCSAACDEIEQPAVNYEIVMSLSSNRSNVVPLNGESVLDEIFVFVTPEDQISQVDFYLDDANFTGSAFQTERMAPYDLRGGSSSSANPFNVNPLSKEMHNISARITTHDGTVVVVRADFEVEYGKDIQKGHIWVEAEHYNSIVYPLRIANDSNASNGNYIHAPNGVMNNWSSGTHRMTTYTINVAETGDYVIWGRVHASNGENNSFFIQMDNGDTYLWDTPTSSDWMWARVDHRGGPDLQTVHLTAGTHTLRVKLREDGTKIDKLLVTNDLSYLPQGLGN